MSGYRIKPEQWEEYDLAENGIGVCDLHAVHVKRVAELLSEKYPGILFLWDAPDQNGSCTISAVREDKRVIPSKVESAIVAAGEAIAANVARKYPVSQRSGLARLLLGPKRYQLKPGWHFTPK